MEREVIHQRDDKKRKGLPGFIYQMNSLNPVPIVGGYNNDEIIVVHGYEIRRGPEKDEKDEITGFTISYVNTIEDRKERKDIEKLLRQRGFEQKIEFW